MIRCIVLGSSALLMIGTLSSPTAGATPATVTGFWQRLQGEPRSVQRRRDPRGRQGRDVRGAGRESATVPPRNLDGSGYLSRQVGQRPVLDRRAGLLGKQHFNYDRRADQFEQVMAYFWIDRAQAYLQSLGFGSTLRPANEQQQTVKIDQYGGDNFFETDQPFRIRYGKGGVDDAEDAEVIVHEYGHAVHNAQAPGFGMSEQAGAMTS